MTESLPAFLLCFLEQLMI